MGNTIRRVREKCGYSKDSSQPLKYDTYEEVMYEESSLYSNYTLWNNLLINYLNEDDPKKKQMYFNEMQNLNNVIINTLEDNKDEYESVYQIP